MVGFVTRVVMAQHDGVFLFWSLEILGWLCRWCWALVWERGVVPCQSEDVVWRRPIMDMDVVVVVFLSAHVSLFIRILAQVMFLQHLPTGLSF